VVGILLVKYEPSFAIITLVTLTLYITFTFKVTNWRTALRRRPTNSTPPPTPAPSTA
jgi:ATP-binding cassette subfamily B protein